MTIAHAIMQTILYSALAICGMCLLAVLTLFVVLERPWQKQAEAEVHASSTPHQAAASHRHVDQHASLESTAKDGAVFRSYIGEMQVIGEEPDQDHSSDHLV